MIYFLVNNTYHLDFDELLMRELSDFDLGLIVVPFSFDFANDKILSFNKIYKFEDNFNLSYFNYFSLKKTMKEIDKAINAQSTDILFVHTDMVLLNQLIIYKFYKSKAKIYLLEDGTATMSDFNIEPAIACFKSRIKCFCLNKLFGFKNTYIKRYGSQDLYRLEDHFFKALIVSFGLKTKRNIKVLPLLLKDKPLDIIYPKGAMFFNSPFYLIYTTENKYLNFVKSILEISKNFDPFYFNFHPNDSISFKNQITNYIKEKYPRIIILPDGIAEEKIKKYTTKYSISINSTASFNLIKKGITPIFLNKIFLEKFKDPSFEQFELLLESIGYNSPEKLNSVNSSFAINHVNFMNSRRYKISDILRENY